MKFIKKGLIVFLITTLIAIVAIVSKNALHKNHHTELRPAPSLEELNHSISMAQKYYEGLYKELGTNKAVMAEYYSSPKQVYTIRHATIGGYHYYDYIGNATKSAKLKRTIESLGLDKRIDPHSLVWVNKSNLDNNYFYSKEAYRDCNLELPESKNLLPYRSKVCKLGEPGMRAFSLISRFDTFLPMVETLSSLEKGQKIDIKKFENRYNNLGFGIPMCSPIKCSNVASAFRTAYFGEIALRTKNWQYADSVASNLISAQNHEGAIYISYDKNGDLKESKPIVYRLLDKILTSNFEYGGFVPTNAETMNDVLAFLLHYRCEKYHACQ